MKVMGTNRLKFSRYACMTLHVAVSFSRLTTSHGILVNFYWENKTKEIG